MAKQPCIPLCSKWTPLISMYWKPTIIWALFTATAAYNDARILEIRGLKNKADGGRGSDGREYAWALHPCRSTDGLVARCDSAPNHDGRDGRRPPLHSLSVLQPDPGCIRSPVQGSVGRHRPRASARRASGWAGARGRRGRGAQKSCAPERGAGRGKSIGCAVTADRVGRARPAVTCSW